MRVSEREREIEREREREREQPAPLVTGPSVVRGWKRRRERLPSESWPEREFFIDNLLVRIHLIIDMILVDRLCALGV